MECVQCGRRAVYGARETADTTIPLCLHCYLIWTQIKATQTDSLARHLNFVLSEMEFVSGFDPGSLPRWPERRVLQVEGVTLNNIKIDNSAIGVVNTGHIGSVDAAVTVLRQEGAPILADALQHLTEAVTASADLSKEAKAEVVELLSAISNEAVAPPAERRRAVVMPLLDRVNVLIGGALGLMELWDRFRPLVEALFK